MLQLHASIIPVTNMQPEVNECLKAQEVRKRPWESDAPETNLRNTLWAKIFMSTGISTQFLDNADVREYHRVVDPKYNLPSKSLAKNFTT